MSSQAPTLFQPKARNKAVFFSRITSLQIKGGLGRGERFANDIYVTNDKNIISSLLSPDWLPNIGTLEFNHLAEARVVAYSNREIPTNKSDLDALNEFLMSLDHFESVFWLNSDNCVGHELAFVVNGDSITSNMYGGLRTQSDASETTLNISADHFREIVRVYREYFAPKNTSPARIHTSGNSTRLSRALSLVGRSQHTGLLAEKITFYCSALEAMFSTSQAELSHQIAERVALISATELADRLETYRFLKRCYSFRSRYIHGSTIKELDEKKVAEISKQLDQVVRKSIEHALRDKEFGQAIKDEHTLDEYMLRKIME